MNGFSSGDGHFALSKESIQRVWRKKKKKKKNNHQRSLDQILYYVSGREDCRHWPLLGGAHSMWMSRAIGVEGCET